MRSKILQDFYKKLSSIINTIPDTFDEWVEAIGGIDELNSLYNAYHDSRVQNEQMYRYIKDTDPITQEFMQEEFLKIRNKYNSFSFPLTVYRMMGFWVEDLDDLSNIAEDGTVGFGIYWTPSYDVVISSDFWAETYETLNGPSDINLVLFRAEVEEHNIDWINTILVNIMPDTNMEEEIRLLDNTTIHLTGIQDTNTENWINLDFIVKS